MVWYEMVWYGMVWNGDLFYRLGVHGGDNGGGGPGVEGLVYQVDPQAEAGHHDHHPTQLHLDTP